jgi:hypothetical protein
MRLACEAAAPILEAPANTDAADPGPEAA